MGTKLIKEKCGCIYYDIVHPEGDKSRLYIGYCDRHLKEEKEIDEEAVFDYILY